MVECSGTLHRQEGGSWAGNRWDYGETSIKHDSVVTEKTALIKSVTTDAVNALAHKLKAWGAVYKAGSVLHSRERIHAVCWGCKMKSPCQGVYTKVWIFAGGTSSQNLIIHSQLHPLKNDVKQYHSNRCVAFVASCRDLHIYKVDLARPATISMRTRRHFQALWHPKSCQANVPSSCVWIFIILTKPKYKDLYKLFYIFEIYNFHATLFGRADGVHTSRRFRLPSPFHRSIC